MNNKTHTHTHTRNETKRNETTEEAEKNGGKTNVTVTRFKIEIHLFSLHSKNEANDRKDAVKLSQHVRRNGKRNVGTHYE